MPLSHETVVYAERDTVAERFWSKVEVVPGSCWTWTAARNKANGYGWFSFRGAPTVAHRVAWTLVHGEIPEGMEIGHRCHDEDLSCAGGPSCPHRACVNPGHLEPMTHRANCRNGERGRSKNACRRGHALSAGNTMVTTRGTQECRTCRRERRLARDRARNNVMPENYRV